MITVTKHFSRRCIERIGQCPDSITLQSYIESKGTLKAIRKEKTNKGILIFYRFRGTPIVFVYSPTDKAFITVLVEGVNDRNIKACRRVTKDYFSNT